MKIRLTKGTYAGLVCDHSPHAAHELIRRGLAEEVVAAPVAAAAPAPAVVEVAAVAEPEHVEHAVKPKGKRGRR